MEKFVMDDAEQSSFRREVEDELSLKWLRKQDRWLITHALEYLNKLVEGPPERIFDRFHTVRNSIKKQYNFVNSGMFMYDLMWAYMCVIAYYKKKDNLAWKESILPEMERLAIHSDKNIIIERGKEKVNEYIKRREKLSHMLAQQQERITTPPTQNETTSSQFKIAKRKKIDVEKVMYFMMKLGLFSTADDTELKEKDFMIAVGRFFDEDFSGYLQAINKSKEMNNFLNIFIDLHAKAGERI